MYSIRIKYSEIKRCVAMLSIMALTLFTVGMACPAQSSDKPGHSKQPESAQPSVINEPKPILTWQGTGTPYAKHIDLEAVETLRSFIKSLPDSDDLTETGRKIQAIKLDPKPMPGRIGGQNSIFGPNAQPIEPKTHNTAFLKRYPDIAITLKKDQKDDLSMQLVQTSAEDQKKRFRECRCNASKKTCIQFLLNMAVTVDYIHYHGTEEDLAILPKCVMNITSVMRRNGGWNTQERALLNYFILPAMSVYPDQVAEYVLGEYYSSCESDIPMADRTFEPYVNRIALHYLVLRSKPYTYADRRYDLFHSDVNNAYIRHGLYREALQWMFRPREDGGMHFRAGKIRSVVKLLYKDKDQASKVFSKIMSLAKATRRAVNPEKQPKRRI